MFGLVVPKIECVDSSDKYGRFLIQPLEKILTAKHLPKQINTSLEDVHKDTSEFFLFQR